MGFFYETNFIFLLCNKQKCRKSDELNLKDRELDIKYKSIVK
jgi:hypothetical protein